MSDHAGFAAAITVREYVLRTALQSAYANGSDAGKRFTEDLSDAALGMEPDLFLGMPDLICEGATNLLVVTMPMWGMVKVTQSGVEHLVQMFGEMELTLTPSFRTGPLAEDRKTAIELNPIILAETITARSWTAAVTSSATPPEVASLITGSEFRSRFEEKFRQGVLVGQIALPTIDASFLGGVVHLAQNVVGRVRNGALLIGLEFVNDSLTLEGDPNDLQDFAGDNDVASVVHPDAMVLMLDEIRVELVKGVESAGASLGDSFSVLPRDGYFLVSGVAKKAGGAVSFSFRVLPSMYRTRPGAYFNTRRGPVRVHSRTWPALGFRIESVDTDVDRSWWVILFGEVLLGIVTVGMSVLLIESLFRAASSAFRGRIRSKKPSGGANRVRRTIPPPGGVSVRIGLDQFDITDGGVFVGISVRPTPSPTLLLGPIALPANYALDEARYILRPPSGVSLEDPALRISWILENRNDGSVLLVAGGSANSRSSFDFIPGSFAATEFDVQARLYRRLGSEETEIARKSVNVHMRPSLPPEAYVRWQWRGSTPQLQVDPDTDEWVYAGLARRTRWSEWHSTTQPCLAVNAQARSRDIETADRLPFSLRDLEIHRKGLCPYCFYGGPAGVNASL